jgi:hypothetical protein
MNSKNKFIIYTTGISSWGSNDIIDAWIDYRRNNILKCINERFTEIYIYHYDPLLNYYNLELSDTKENIIKNINSKLELPKNGKIKEEIFINESFNYLIHINFDILIDFAHIFGYKYNDIDKNYLFYNNYYNENKSSTEKIKNIKCIYISYPNNNSILENITFFKIDDNYNIITYSEKLLELGYNYKYSPIDIIETIFNNIKNNIYLLWRKKYLIIGNYFDLWFNKNKLIILNQICENIYNNNKENLENFENYNIIIPNLNITKDIL